MKHPNWVPVLVFSVFESGNCSLHIPPGKLSYPKKRRSLTFRKEHITFHLLLRGVFSIGPSWERIRSPRC